MRKIISGIIAAVMLFVCTMNITVTAFDGKYEITADKTAQWTAQEKASGYDLRIHGYKAWETAGYIGFSLPENFTSENLVSAKLELYTVSYNKSGNAYLYSADYGAFESGAQYEGSAEQPEYAGTELLAFTSPSTDGIFDIDISDYMRTVTDNTAGIAFRIDVKSQNTNNKWVIGSCNNGSPAPKLILDYDDPSVVKSEISVNITYNDEALTSYTDKAVGTDKYSLTNEQIRYIRKNNDIYYLPYNAETDYDINSAGSTVINVPFEKLSEDGLIFFEDFTADTMSELSERGVSASADAQINNGALAFSSDGTLTLPETGENSGVTVSFDFIADGEAAFTLKDSGEICTFGYNSDMNRHRATVTVKNGTASVRIDGAEISGTATTAKSVQTIAVSGSAAIDNLTISAENLTYDGFIKNNEFAGGTDAWTINGNAYVTDDLSNTFMAMKETSSIAQSVQGIENGTYDIHALVKSDSMSNTGYVYAKAKGHPIMKTSVSVTTYTNNNEWRDIYIRGINIDEGECEVGLVLDQLNPDEVRVYPQIPDEPLPDGKGTVKVKSIELSKSNSNDNFLVGGDINWLTFLEEKGVQYFDENGAQKDAIQVMAENGANIVRLRLYNDPGKGHGDGADYLPAGYQNPEDILNLAKRAKEKGMQIQLTFHYSDYWSNAETQLIPHEWQEEIDKLGADATQDEKDAKVEELLYEFTKDFMQKMKDQGTEPEYVSFGNEMHTGLLFSKGRKDYDYGSTYRQSRLASLLTTANKAAKEVSPDTKVILHLDGAGQKSKYNTFFNNCRDYNIPYDVIGISYYPYWYPTVDVDGLVDFCNYLVNTFDKDIMFMETGYSFVDKNLIGGQDTRFTDVGPYTDTFGMSKMGQKAFMEELYNGLKQTIGGRCLGDLYWDPIMIQHEGVGWAYKESDDSIEHNKNISITLFDTDGYKLPAQNIFKDNGYITDTVTFAGRISGIDAGDSVTLTVNDAAYTILPDRFGDYVLRVPYADTLAVSVSGAEEKYTIDMRAESVKRDIDFTVAGSTDDCISEITANFDENGALSYKVSYQAITENPTLYAAVYNSGGKLIACQINKPQGLFDTLSGGDIYTIKAFLWDNEMKPLCAAKGQKAGN